VTRFEDENESLMMQLKKMATRSRSTIKIYSQFQTHYKTKFNNKNNLRDMFNKYLHPFQIFTNLKRYDGN